MSEWQRVLPYFIGPAWFIFVWWVDDLLGAWLAAVGMLGIALFALWEAGAKKIQPPIGDS